MKITDEIRNAILVAAREHIASTGQPQPAALAAALGVSATSVGVVLREAEGRGELARTCAFTWSGGERCGAPLAGTTAAGHLARKVCGLHRERGGVRSVERRGLDREAAPAPVAAVLEEPAPDTAPSARAAETDSTGLVLRIDVVDGWPLSIVREGGDEVPTVADAVLAERLGFSGGPNERLRALRKLDDRHRDEIGAVLPMSRTDSRQIVGEKRTRLYTEEQATLLTMFARTPVAREQRAIFVAVIKAWRRQRAMPPPALDPNVAAILGEMRADRAANDARFARLEAIVGSLRRPPARPALPPTTQVVIELNGVTRREPVPAFASLREIRRFSAVDGFDTSVERLRRIGFALRVVGDPEYGGERTVTDCSRSIKIGWGANRRGIDAILGEAKRLADIGGRFDDFLTTVEPVGTGAWTSWQSTRPKPRRVS